MARIWKEQEKKEKKEKKTASPSPKPAPPKKKMGANAKRKAGLAHKRGLYPDQQVAHDAEKIASKAKNSALRRKAKRAKMERKHAKKNGLQSRAPVEGEDEDEGDEEQGEDSDDGEQQPDRYGSQAFRGLLAAVTGPPAEDWWRNVRTPTPPPNSVKEAEARDAAAARNSTNWAYNVLENFPLDEGSDMPF